MLDEPGAERLFGKGDLLCDLGRGLVRAQFLFIPQRNSSPRSDANRTAPSKAMSHLRQRPAVCCCFSLVRNLREPA
ncbi:hypothetical protein [Bradyrhizobium sp. SZCCHNR2028]|uniref:hypothetical protein n=1 Tax=Bradyrhizobium sp. SZCCHNR2028 TaxID=3057382 RepID=UPI0028E58FDB|nr:hypothetical protein [Bradyrhizobium sp. SZCCHNR2028]